MRAWTSRRHWGRYYVGLALACGLAYSMLPAGSFYAPNVSHEAPWIQQLRVRVGTLLLDELNALSSRVPERSRSLASADFKGLEKISEFVELDSAVLRPVSVSNLQVADDGTITVSGRAYLDVGAPKVSEVSGPFRADVDLSHPMMITQGVAYYLVTPVADSDRLSQLAVTHGLSDPSFTPNDATALVPISARTARAAAEMRAVYGGDPKHAPGNSWRMLYLSVSTVTTLGLGDITPLSTTARLLVTSEAILGVVFAGLFIASIPARREERRAAVASASAVPAAAGAPLASTEGSESAGALT